MHIIGWLIGTAEVWIALRFMGIPVSVNEAVVIESLVQAVRGAAFAIPGALGAQEAGLILLCGMFAIPPDQALALSLIKRAADLIVHQRQPLFSTWTMPLITRRSSARSTPRTSVGRCGSIRFHCSSLSQNRFLRISQSPSNFESGSYSQRAKINEF